MLYLRTELHEVQRPHRVIHITFTAYPTLEIVAQTIKRPDGTQGVQAIAVVTNPDGKDRTSAPGVEWSANGLTNVGQSAIDVDGGGVRSVLTGIPQPGVQPVIYAKWRDETGRIVTTHNP